MKLNFKTALVLAPHTDDGEFGCGGTITKLIEEGCEVHYAAFSACEKSVKRKYDPKILIKELGNATNILGIKQKDVHLFEFDVRVFAKYRQEILDSMIQLRDKINPELILMPQLTDIHQDHATVANEGLRAFKFSTIFCYEMPWNNLTINTSGFVKLGEKHIETKIRALKMYESQAHRPYANEEFIRSLARTRGVQISTKYAETFEVLRLTVD